MKPANLYLALLLAPASAGLLTVTGCSSVPATPAERANLTDESQTQLQILRRDYPDVSMLLDNSYGYAIFPSVGKGGLVIEGASGKGNVYEQGKQVGTAHMTLVNVGAVVGGEEYVELLVFKTKAAMDNFKANQLHFDATAAAVALKAGASADAKFINDVAAFKKSSKGLILDASIGGQQFTYTASDASGSMMSQPATAPSM